MRGGWTANVRLRLRIHSGWHDGDEAEAGFEPA